MVTLVNDRNEILANATSRVVDASVEIVASDSIFTIAEGATTTSPATTTLSTIVYKYNTPAYVWSKSIGGGAFSTLVGATDPTLVVTGDAGFVSGLAGATYVQYKVVVSQDLFNTSEYIYTIPVIREGIDGTSSAVVNITNDGNVYPAQPTLYAGITFGSSTSVLTAYIGVTQLTYGASGANTFSCTNSSTGATVAAGTGGGSIFTVPVPTAMSADTAYTDVVVTLRGPTGTTYATITKRINYALARAGATGGTGAAASFVTINGDQTFKFLDGSATPTVTNITLTATLAGTLTTYDWEYWTGAAWANLAGTNTNSTYTVAYNATEWGSNTTLRVRCLSGSSSDEITLVKLYDATNAVTGYLTNESVTVASASDGTGYSLATAGGTFKVYKGITDFTTSAIFNITGGTDAGTTWSKTQNGLVFTINETTGVYSLSGTWITTDIESFTVTALYSTVTITKVYTITRARAGVPGITGNLSSDSYTVPMAITGVGNFAGCATTMSVYSGTTDVSGSATYSVTKSVGLTCTEATTSRTQTVTAMTTDVGTVTIAATYAGVTITNVFTVTKGVIGGVTANLSNESHGLPTTTAGVVTYTGAVTTMSVYVGAVDDSTNWTYAVTKSTGVVCTEATTSRTQTVTAVTTDISTVTIVASKTNYASITKVFTLTKNNQGATGSAGAAGTNPLSISYTNGAHTVPVTNLGVETWTGSGGLLTVFEGSTLLTLKSNTQSTTYPTITTENGQYVLDVTRISGDTLTEPAITGATLTVATLDVWASNLTTATVYRVTAYIRTLAGATATLSTDITISPSFQGDDSTVYGISSSAPVIYKDAIDAATAGTYTTITLQGKKTVGATTTNFGFISTTENGGAETARTDTSVTALSYTMGTGKSSVTVKNYSAITGGVLLDTQVINAVFKGATGITGSSYSATISGGTRALTYNTAGTAVTPTTSAAFTVVLQKDGSAVTPTSISWVGTGLLTGGTGATTATYTPAVTATYSTASTYITCTLQHGSPTITTVVSVPIAIAQVTKSSRVAYILSESASAPTVTGAVSGDAVPTNTLTKTIGGAGTYAWSFTATSTLLAGQFMYQADGFYDSVSNVITWGTAYLSNLKVGSLSALTVNTGALTVDDALTMGTTGHIKGGQTAYGVGKGFFLGYSGAQYKFSLGSPSIPITSINLTTDVLTLTGHTYVTNSMISFSSVGTVTGIVVDTTYYVRDVSGDTFKLASIYGGSAIALAGTTGTMPVILGSYLQWDGSGLSLKLDSLICSGPGQTASFITSGAYPAVIVYGNSAQQQALRVDGRADVENLYVTTGNPRIYYSVEIGNTLYFTGHWEYANTGIKNYNPSTASGPLIYLTGLNPIYLGGYASSASKTNHRNCIVASTANVPIGTGLTVPLIVDGYTFPSTDTQFNSIDAKTILLKNQTTTTENGAYVYNLTGATTYELVRSPDMNITAELTNSLVYISTGTTNKGKLFTCTSGTIGTAIVFAEYLGAGEAFTSKAIEVNPAGGNILYTRDLISSSTFAIDLEAKKTASSVVSIKNTETNGRHVKLGNIDNAIELVTGGIKFPATFVDSSNVNTLDDYEEGTWTASPTCTGSGVSVVASSASYTKIGRATHFTIRFAFTGDGTAGNLTFSLPSTANYWFPFTAWVAGADVNMVGPICAWVDTSSSTVTVAAFKLADGTIPGDFALMIKSGTDLRVSGTYW